jgi:hypothetical protein
MTAQPIATESSIPGPTGPRTPEGKARCRLNAFRHGLTGHQFVFSPDEAESYAEHSRAIHKHYAPAGPIEEALVRQIADGIWRLDRASAIEHGIFALAYEPSSDETEVALAPARTWVAEGKNLALLTLYVKRIENKLDANKAELMLIQAERKREAAEAMNQAIAIRRAAEIEGKPYEPESYFNPAPAVKESVFSEDLVTREIARRETLQSARKTVSIATRQPLSHRDAA